MTVAARLSTMSPVGTDGVASPSTRSTASRRCGQGAQPPHLETGSNVNYQHASPATSAHHDHGERFLAVLGRGVPSAGFLASG